MFAFGARIEVIIRITLTVVILFNALLPTVAANADSLSSKEESGGDAIHSGQVSARIQTNPREMRKRGALPEINVLYQADPPTETPTPTPTSTDSGTALAEPSPTASPEAITTVTPVFQSASTETQTALTNGVAPTLSFSLSVSPEQAAPGDQVTFTVVIKNVGQTEARNIQFSNTLPQEFGNSQGGFKGLDFDPQTRLLGWKYAEKPLQPGQTLTLQYNIVLDHQLGDEIQIVDSGELRAEGLATPLIGEATVTVLPPEKQFTQLGAQGGKAIGLNGRVQVDVPEGALEASEGILIQELKNGNDVSVASTASAGLLFSLERRSSGDPISASKEDQVHSLQAKEASFDEPVKLTVSLDGITDLGTLSAEYAPYLVTLDEASGTWVRIPLKGIDPEANTITAEIDHFSTWGAGFGPSFPQNGANVLLFDSAYPSLFTGSSNFSLPIWTPPGRNGMAPSLALTYTSATANGVLGDIQAQWVGMGWNIDSAEISRKITNGYCDLCGADSYGYKNEFLLSFNGTGYELIPDGTTSGRYHTESESFLYIQFHSPKSPVRNGAQNATGEWWEVVEKDGTRWRLGWNVDSEQLAAMKGYPGTFPLPGTWNDLGYAGRTPDVVAMRWRVDLVTDTHGNQMSFIYEEENRLVDGTQTNYDRASYLKKITYTEHTSGSVSGAYSVEFSLIPRIPRDSGEMPETIDAWDNWDTKLLGRIDVKYGETTIRSYDLDYDLRPYNDDGKSWETTVLTSIAVSGGGVSAPTVTFTYTDKDNRANCGEGCQEWAYPRLESISNGWGGSSILAYENDGRPSTTWYNWRVASIQVTDGLSANPMKTTYTYNYPCYKNEYDSGELYRVKSCVSDGNRDLVGHGEVIASTMDFDGMTALARTVHK